MTRESLGAPIQSPESLAANLEAARRPTGSRIVSIETFNRGRSLGFVCINLGL